MSIKNVLKSKSLELRKKGFSFKYIAEHLKVPKSTIYEWAKNIILTEDAIHRINATIEAGRVKGRLAIKSNSILRDRVIEELALKTITRIKFKKNILKLLCAVLYWGEGEKSNNKIAFTNSDPSMVKTFLKLFRNNFPLNEGKFSAFLHLHSYHNRETQLEFWSIVTGIHKDKIHVYNKASSGKSKKLNYPGCISIRYHDIKIAKEVYYLYTKFSEI